MADAARPTPRGHARTPGSPGSAKGSQPFDLASRREASAGWITTIDLLPAPCTAPQRPCVFIAAEKPCGEWLQRPQPRQQPARAPCHPCAADATVVMLTAAFGTRYRSSWLAATAVLTLPLHPPMFSDLTHPSSRSLDARARVQTSTTVVAEVRRRGHALRVLWQAERGAATACAALG